MDLALSDATVKNHHVPQIKRFYNWLGGKEVTTDVIREYLKRFKGMAPSTRANVLKAFRRFFRDFLGRGELVATFRIPNQPFKPKTIPTREQLQKSYTALEALGDRTMFLLYATTGLRKHELLSIRLKDIEFERRMVTPQSDGSQTKRTWVTFFNEEASSVLKEYLDANNGFVSDARLFPSEKSVRLAFKKAKEITGIHVTPQVLREWFCNEMLSKGIQEVYVDAFCGRVPKSVLARHYTDFSPERLKEIYDKANLRVFT